MRILVDVNHPAHVHLFRNAVQEWLARGDEVLITARDKEVVVGLLERYGLDYELLSRERRGLLGLGVELVERDWRLWRLARRFRPHFLIGTSPSAAHVAPLVRGTSVFFCEDDRAAVPLQAAISYPFAHWVCTPDALAEDYGRKHVKHPSYHELAYLHPNRFVPDPSVRTLLGIGEGERYFVMRFVGLHAHHDRKERGLPREIKLKVFDFLRARGRVFITSETPLAPPFEESRISLPPDKLHDVIAGADLVVSDSQTVTAEAAVLGVPNLRCNSFVGRLSYLEELEHRYGLTKGLLPEQGEELCRLVEDWVADDSLREKFAAARSRMLAEKCDLTDWIVQFLDRLQNGARARGVA